MPMFIPKSRRSLPVQPKPKPGPSRPPEKTTSSKPSTSRTSSAGSPRPPNPSPSTEIAKEEDKTNSDEPYEDFKIFTPSAADLASGRKYNLFKFESRKTVNPAFWPRPVKLNRKDPAKQMEEEEDIGDVKLTPMLGPDGKPVIGPDGRLVMVGLDGRPALQHSRTRPNPDQPSNSKKKPFQRKTRQIFTIPEGLRQLRKEERFPWLLEDGSGNEVWNARLDELSKSDNHGFLVPREMEAGAFVFYPSHRFYKFAKKSKRKHMGAEEAEEELARLAKGRPTPAWLKKAAKQEVKNVSLGPGGRRLKAVDSGQKTKFEQDDEFGGSTAKARAKELGGDGDADEMEYESDFADDDEGGAMDAMDEEEAKELEERIKKEYRTAEKVDEPSEDEEDLKQLSGAGKDMKKLFKRLDKGQEEESDKEENPFQSSEDESSEEEIPMEIGPQQQPQQVKKNGGQPVPAVQTSSVGPSKQSTPSTSAISPPQPSQAPGSRAVSPMPLGNNTPGYGASLIAKRATSPKAPRPRPSSPNHSRATSPLANGSSSRAASPNRSAVNSRSGSPGLSVHTNVNGKRRADEQESVSSPTATSPGAGAPNGRALKKPRLAVKGPLTEDMIIEWIKNTENPTSKECINRFRSYIKEDSAKAEFTAMIKKLVILKDGKMVLKPAYSGGSGNTPSTPAMQNT